MDNSPYSDRTALDKVHRLRAQLESVLGRPLALLEAPHGRNQGIFTKECSAPYQCVLCKRMMLHVAKAVALRKGAEAIVTGESLGQVASQTLHNLRVETQGLHFPVIRPLIGLDKLEIEHIAKTAGTYEISISHPSVCTIVPHHPITMCGSEDLKAQEARIDLAEMTRYAAERAEEIQRS
jgi:thiamine biosynthesis protein ThiI